MYWYKFKFFSIIKHLKNMKLAILFQKITAIVFCKTINFIIRSCSLFFITNFASFKDFQNLKNN